MAELVVVGGGEDLHGCSSGSCYALVSDRGTYLLDCGESCGARVRQYGIDPLSVRTVFISHMHHDHVAGLFGFLSSVWMACRRESEIPPGVFEWASRSYLPDSALPESLKVIVPQEGVRPLETFLPAVYLGKELWHFDFGVESIDPGLFYQDDHIQVWAHPNGHLSSQPTYKGLPKAYPGLVLESYSFSIEVEGKRLVYSGDLAALGEDGVDEFRPVAWGADLLVAEVAHVPPEYHLDMLAATDAKRVLLVHLHGGLEKRVIAHLAEHPDERFVVARNGVRIEM